MMIVADRVDDDVDADAHDDHDDDDCDGGVVAEDDSVSHDDDRDWLC